MTTPDPNGALRAEHGHITEPVEVVARLLHARIVTAGCPHLPPSGQAARAAADWDERPDGDWRLFRLQASEIVAAVEPLVEARVRAQVAEEIARKIEAKKPSAAHFWDAADASRVYTLNDAAKIAREHARPTAGTDQPQDRTEEKL